MDITSLGQTHLPSKSLEKIVSEVEVKSSLPTTDEAPKTIPSTIVSISDEGMALQVKDAHAAMPVSTYVEKTDAEYQAMTYQQLIDERDSNDNGVIDKSNEYLTVMPHYDGRAGQIAEMKLNEQVVRNSQSNAALTKSLDAFKAQIVKDHPELAETKFDVSFKDGKVVISGDGLSKKDTEKLLKILDDKKNPTSIKLKESITDFNNEALKLINMQIYEEKDRFGGENSPLVHRKESMTMEEFTKEISYSAVAQSNGTYTSGKYSSIIGSTHYGSKLVYKS